MRRALLLVLLLLASTVPVLADGPWQGTWDTRWRDGGARLTLEQDGNHVVGQYPLYGGRLEGTATGSRLDGHWTEADRSSGGFVFVLNRDGKDFAGRYDTGEWWTGARTNRPDLVPASDLSTPRDTMRSFTIDGNLARAGLPDAWGAASEAIDFGPGAAAASRAERLALTIALFDLVDLTTFRIWAVSPEATGDTVTIELPQSGTDTVLSLTMARAANGSWRIRMPSSAEMAATRRALLAPFGGQPPASDAYKRLPSPRDTMRAFVEGMADWDGPGRALALSTLDLSGIPEGLRDANGSLAAQYLRRVIDRIGLIGLQSIPNNVPDRQAYTHLNHPAGRIVIAPIGEGANTRWKFTTRTVADIDRIFVAVENLPPPLVTPEGLIPSSTFFTWRSLVRAHVPVLLGEVGDVEYWQILAALLMLTTTIVLGFLGATLVIRGLHRLAGPDIVEQPRVLAWSIGTVIAAVIGSRIVPALGIPEHIRQYTYPLAGVLVTVGGAVAAWQVIGLAGRLLDLRTQRTVTAADDILLTLILAATRFAIVILAALGVAYFLSLPTAGMLAGLGIGGVAVAFASRETISNVFGAGILVSDRPFGRGDWIIAGDVEGAVEHLGIRSTRVRTAQDSVMVVPNGKLADSTINNLGTRRHRLVRTRLLVTAGGKPKRLDAFVAALRQRIVDDPACVTGRSEVGVVGITEQGIEIDLTTYLDVSSFSAERATRHALMLDIVRLAADQGLTLGAGMRDAEDAEAAEVEAAGSSPARG